MHIFQSGKLTPWIVSPTDLVLLFVSLQKPNIKGSLNNTITNRKWQEATWVSINLVGANMH